MTPEEAALDIRNRLLAHCTIHADLTQKPLQPGAIIHPDDLTEAIAEAIRSHAQSLKQKLELAEEVLRNLACYVGAGGYNAPEVDPIAFENKIREGIAALTEPLEQQLAQARQERDKLQAFKDWVHNYLDRHGVPHHPPGTHGAAGCRIGDRMDWLMGCCDLPQPETDEEEKQWLEATDRARREMEKEIES